MTGDLELILVQIGLMAGSHYAANLLQQLIDSYNFAGR